MDPQNADLLAYKPCEGNLCHGKGHPTFFCLNCDSHFCDICWVLERAHRPEKRGPDGLAHEKTNSLVVERYQNILEPPSDSIHQQALHRRDEDTTWFGIGRNADGAATFEDYERYATLMNDSSSFDHPERYPQLVSFIGQTGMITETFLIDR